jgi:hypothetical protein
LFFGQSTVIAVNSSWFVIAGYGCFAAVNSLAAAVAALR